MWKRAAVTITAIVALAVPASADFSNAQTEEWKCLRECTRDLIAAQNIDVGKVVVHWHDSKIVVEYFVEEPGWALREAHFEFSNAPITNKPAPGQMTYGFENLSGTYFTFEIPHTVLCDDDKSGGDGCACYFAAHAVVYQDNCPEKFAKTIFIQDNYPDVVEMKVAPVGRFGYFNVWLRSAPGWRLNGDIYSGWCLDARKPLEQGKWYTADVIYEWDLLGDYVERVENMALIEWITEQPWRHRVILGQPVTVERVQNAIWHLAHGRGIGPYAQQIVDEARAAVLSKNFERRCWTRGASFVLLPRYCECEGDACACTNDLFQPVFSYRSVREECPTPTPTPTSTHTYTATNTRRPPTKTPTRRPPTKTPTGTFTPPPTDTPTHTHTYTHTPTETHTPTPTPCQGRTETAWAYGQWEFTTSWGWSFKCCREADDKLMRRGAERR